METPNHNVDITSLKRVVENKKFKDLLKRLNVTMVGTKFVKGEVHEMPKL